MFKRVLISVLCLFMLIISSTSTFSLSVSNKNIESQDLIVPYMNYISGTNLRLSKNQSGRAEIYCRVSGYLGTTTKIEVTAYLQEYKNGTWQTIRTYTQTSNSHIASMTRESAVSSGRSYRVTVLVQAYSGERSEIQIIRSKEVRF